MANKHRGYVPIEIGGETYQLRYDFNALAQLDQRLGQSFFKVLSEGNIGLHVIREALVSGLSNPANGRGAATKALQHLEVAKVDYYIDKIFEGLEAAGLIKPKDAEGDDTAGGDEEGEA